MKKILFIIWLSTFCTQAIAQDESFRGGSADGFSLQQNSTALGYPLSFQPYLGGVADGFAVDSNITFQQTLQPLNYAAYAGNSGDGFTADSLVNFPQYSFIRMFTPYSGSNGDGYSSDSLIAYPQFAYIRMFTPYSGNMGDGFSSDSIIPVPQFDYIRMFQPYAGGEADGWTGYPIFGVVVIPVNLLEFSGIQRESKHFLQWKTIQEQNSDYFQLERSNDGRQFYSLGKVPASGNSQSEKVYHFTDSLPIQGNNFYRLRIYDKDGSSKYSNIILLKLLGNNTSISIYPNPASKTLQVHLDGNPDNSKFQAAVYDLSGKRMSGSISKINSGFEVQIAHLPAGVYILRVYLNQEHFVWKFIKE